MSTFRFAHPLALLLLLAVALIAAAVSRRVGSSRTPREHLPALLPALALALLVLALAAPQIDSNRPTVLAVDRSASIDPHMRAVERKWTASVTRDDCTQPCRVVRFAAGADALDASASPRAVPALGAGATNLQAAIETAIARTRRGGRVVVLSDGGQTQGDALATAGLARSRHVAVDWVPLADPRRRDAAITAIGVPAAVHVGDTVPLSLTVHSTAAAAAVLRVRRDGGAPVAQTIDLRVGDNPLLLFYTATRKGWQSFQTTVSLAGDTIPANDSAAAVTDVTAEPRVLSVGSAGSPISRLLAAQRSRVTQVAPGALPVHAAAYGRYDAVVLDDVSATQLRSAQIAALDSAVRTGGLGLLVLGGPHSFSLGRYWKSALQQILPVSSLIPGNLERRNLAIELVLDHSGSMIDLAGGVPKIEMARAGAKESAAFIAAHHDQLGIVDFDIAPHLLLPLQTVAPGASERRVDRVIATLQANGGTNIFLGLKAGLEQLLASKAKERHLILMTDGISVPANYAPLDAALRREHISVATVALGSDADRPLLAQISAATGGHAYVTDNAHQLPRIFVKETQLAAKPVRVTGHLNVAVSGDSPVVRSLAGKQLPALTGNVVVGLKTGAQADLLASDHGSQSDPALAEWQIGAGRVVAWTPGLGAPWAGAWLRERSLWNDAVRWSERGVSPMPLVPEASGSGSGTVQLDLSDAGTAALGVTGIVGTLTGADAVPHPISFARVGPSLYQANVTSLAAGVYRFQLRTQGTDALNAAGDLALPYPSEYSPVPAMTSPLGQLVTETGGRLLAPGDPGAISSSTHSLRELLTALALAAFLAGVLWRMLPGPRLRRDRHGEPEAARRHEDLTAA
jgi:Ca-activated chloride channel family protein